MTNEELLEWLRYTLSWFDKGTLVEFKKDATGALIAAVVSGNTQEEQA